MNKRVFLAPGKRTAAQAAPRPNSVAPRKRTAAQAAPRPNSVEGELPLLKEPSTRHSTDMIAGLGTWFSMLPWSRCDVPGCQSDSTERIHRVPEDPERRQAWLRRIGWPASKKRARIFVCRRHFSAEDYMQHPGVVQAMGFQAGRIYLNRDALPSLLLPSSPPHAKDPESSQRASTSDASSSTPMDVPPLSPSSEGLCGYTVLTWHGGSKGYIASSGAATTAVEEPA
ncbi:hypothetical protein MRX96_011122 [Rhipicephalus microplus]